MALFKTWIFWSKNNCFLLKISKNYLSDIVSVINSDKRKFNFWTKSMDNPLWKCQFIGPFQNFSFFLLKSSFFSTISQTIFFDIMSVKNADKKKFHFSQNPWTNPFIKCPFFRPFLKLQFFGLKMVVFYPEYQKTIFSEIISVRNSNNRKFGFWTKSME